ncbi:hypothetical protein EYF80_002136 [Liparis tanakae]|uniref:Uncharacterized protein n=1 Tax=Liparis tanakae TaxID=230148 RepID=A0A4Z2JC44_9TELE|nr:hypothetical protein EYF80_002136 [Liparis tanakae]
MEPFSGTVSGGATGLGSSSLPPSPLRAPEGGFLSPKILCHKCASRLHLLDRWRKERKESSERPHRGTAAPGLVVLRLSLPHLSKVSLSQFLVESELLSRSLPRLHVKQLPLHKREISSPSVAKEILSETKYAPMVER